MSVSISVASDYLPEVVSWTLSKDRRESAFWKKDPRYLVLNHLTNPHHKPITERQEIALRESKRASTITSQYLSWRGVALITAGALAAGAGAWRIAKAAEVPDESIGTDFIPATFTTVASLFGGIVGLIITGTLPDWKSDKANKEQNIDKEITHWYSEAGKYLIDLFWSKKREKFDEALRLADAIDMSVIESKLKDTGTQEDMDLIVIKTALAYVKARGTMKPCLGEIVDEIRYHKERKSSKLPPHITSTVSASSTTAS